MKNMTEKAFPLQNGAFEVPSADRLRFFLKRFESLVIVNLKGFPSAFPKSGAQSGNEVAFIIDMAIEFTGAGGEPQAGTICKLRESRTAPQVGEMLDDIFDRIGRILESGCNHEALAILEPAKNPPPRGRNSRPIRQAELLPNKSG